MVVLRVLGNLENLVEVKSTRVERRHLLAMRFYDRFDLLFAIHNQLLDFQPFAFTPRCGVHVDTELVTLGKQLYIVRELAQRPFDVG